MKSTIILSALAGTALLPVVALADSGYYSGTLGARATGSSEDPSYCDPNLTGPSPTINAGTYSASSHILYLGLLYRYGL